MLDLEAQLARYGRVLDASEHAYGAMSIDAPVPGREPRRLATALVAAVLLLAVGLVATVVVNARDDAKKPGGTVVARPPTIGPPTLVERFEGPFYAPFPLARAGGDVWIAIKSGGDRPFVTLERRNPSTGALLATLDLQQQPTVVAIAGNDDALWVVGGGDGAYPETTVSKVDVATNTVVFTKTPAWVCSCRVSVGGGGVWVGADGISDLFHLDPDTGEAIAHITLPSAGLSLATVGTRVQVGLADGGIAVIDSTTNRIERTISIEAHVPNNNDRIVNIVATDGGAAPASFAVSSDGWAYRIIDQREVEPAERLHFSPAAVAGDGGGQLWAVGLNYIARVDGTETPFVVDVTHGETEPVKLATPGTTPAGNLGFRDALLVDGTLWTVYGNSPGGVVLALRVER